MKYETKRITLTVREIYDLARASGLIVQPPEKIDADDEEIEYTIMEREGGVIVAGDDKTEHTYGHGAYITEYPEEGTFPLGEPITTS